MQDSRLEKHFGGHIGVSPGPASTARRDSTAWRESSEVLTVADLLELIETAVEHAVQSALGRFLARGETSTGRLGATGDDRAFRRAVSPRNALAAVESTYTQTDLAGIPCE